MFTFSKTCTVSCLERLMLGSWHDKGEMPQSNANILDVSHEKYKPVVFHQLMGFHSMCRALIGLLTPTQRRMPYLHGQRRGQGLESGWVWAIQHFPKKIHFSKFFLIKHLPPIWFTIRLCSFELLPHSSFYPFFLSHSVSTTQKHTHSDSVGVHIQTLCNCLSMQLR